MGASSKRQAVLQRVADPTRDLIVRLLVERERSVGEIAEQLPVSRPAVSKHLRLLQSTGLVRFRSEGTRNVYALQPEALAWGSRRHRRHVEKRDGPLFHGGDEHRTNP